MVEDIIEPAPLPPGPYSTLSKAQQGKKFQEHVLSNIFKDSYAKDRTRSVLVKKGGGGGSGFNRENDN